MAVETQERFTTTMLKQEKVRRNLCSSFSAFFHFFEPQPNYIYGQHTRDMLHRLQGVADDLQAGISRYIIINIPPRHGKSDITSRRFPLYLLTRNPKWEVILCSYNHELASEMAADARSIILDVEVAVGRRIVINNRVDHWITGEGGRMFVAGLGGTITGRGADVMVIDDYLKNREEAESSVIRNKVWESFQSDIMTRLAPTHAVCIVANRWHDDDLVGRIERRNDPESDEYDPDFPVFEVIRHPSWTEDGGWLFPERFDDAWYRTSRSTMGTYAWQAQGLQNPQPRQGNMLRVDQVNVVTEFPEGLRYQWGWDLASTTAERAQDNPDYTVGTRVAYHEGRLYVDHIIRGQWSKLKRDEQIIQATEDDQGAKVYVEAVGGYVDAYVEIKHLLRGKCLVHKSSPRVDKVARASVIEPLFESGLVYIRRAKWNRLWIDELGAFPSGVKDDQVDSLVIAAYPLVVGRGKMKMSQ